MTIRQLPDFAFRSAGDYATAMDDHPRPLRPGARAAASVDVLERLERLPRSSARRGSASAWSCSSSRSSSARSTGRRGCGAACRDDPGRPARAVLRPAAAGPGRDDAASPPDAVRRRRCGGTASSVREADGRTGRRYLYGDRHQYTKLATLLTHLGLILFLVAAAVTSRLGDEQGLVVAEGESLTVQPIGTPGLLLVKNLGFEAPGLRDRPGRPTSRPTSRSTRTASEIARKTIRVNDPLSVAGYTFHQNGFGPAPDLVIRDADGPAAVGRRRCR